MNRLLDLALLSGVGPLALVAGATAVAVLALEPLARVAGATAVAVLALEPLARARGWTDAPDGGRKRQARAVPAVGGAALAAALALAAASGAGIGDALAARLPAAPHVLPALAAAFLLGWIDDLRARGLGAGAKLAGQCAVGALLAWPLLAVAPATAAALAAAAVIAQNLTNTWDHADGTLVLLAGLGLAGAGIATGAALPAAAVLALAPFNVGSSAPRAEHTRPRLPRVYLGDSGSHVLGVLLLATPAAWGAFLLPALDLARVVVERLAAGARPWQGDRRHLAQRLARAGHSPLAAALLPLCAATPAVLSVALGARPPWLGACLAASALAWAALVRRGRAPRASEFPQAREVGGAGACPGPGVPG